MLVTSQSSKLEKVKYMHRENHFDIEKNSEMTGFPYDKFSAEYPFPCS